MHDFLVSIIVPVYNVENFLEETIASILNQSYKNYEVIFINDGSTDNSADIINSYISSFESVKLINQKNSGLSIARNVGIDASSGEYIYFFDSDDLLEPTALESCVSLMRKKNLDMLFFEATVLCQVDQKSVKGDFLYERPVTRDVVTGLEFFKRSIREQKYIASACCYIARKEVYEKLRFLPNTLHEDNLFTTLALIKGGRRVFSVKEAFFIRRLRPGSIMTKDKTIEHINGYMTCYLELLKELDSDAISDGKKEFAYYIQDLLGGAINTASLMYPLFIPFSLRMRFIRDSFRVPCHLKRIKIALISFFPEILTIKRCMRKKHD